MLNFPVAILLCSLFLFWLASQIGLYAARRRPLLKQDHDDVALVQGATLALMGLLIGFTFSMAVSRYDLRKTYEEGEANAIGTEFVRADLIPAVAASLKSDLKHYTDLRIGFYQTRNPSEQQQINAATNRLQAAMWSTVSKQGQLQPSPMTALVVSGMNDVLNAQGYTQAAWWNRIPVSAWYLLAAIGICGNILVGYSIRTATAKALLLLALPVVLSISFFMIADIDSPRGGLIHVMPQNLVSLSNTLAP